MTAEGAVNRVPRTDAELAVVLAERPPGWEYLYFAGALRLEMLSLESRYRDHEMGYAEVTGERVSLDDFTSWLSAKSDEAMSRVSVLESVLSPESQERAFGAPGVAGDPDAISHLARRATSIYENLLDWAASLRGVTAPAEARGVINAFANYMNGPIDQYRAFVNDTVEQVDAVPEAIAGSSQLRV